MFAGPGVRPGRSGTKAVERQRLDSFGWGDTAALLGHHPARLLHTLVPLRQAGGLLRSETDLLLSAHDCG